MNPEQIARAKKIAATRSLRDAAFTEEGWRAYADLFSADLIEIIDTGAKDDARVAINHMLGLCALLGELTARDWADDLREEINRIQIKLQGTR